MRMIFFKKSINHKGGHHNLQNAWTPQGPNFAANGLHVIWRSYFISKTFNFMNKNCSFRSYHFVTLAYAHCKFSLKGV